MDTKLKMSVIMAAVDKITAPIKNVTNSTAKLTESMKASKAALDKIGTQKKDIDHFKGLKKAIKEIRPELTQQQKLVERLGNEYAQAQKPTAKMRQELTKAENRLQSLKGELRDNQQNLKGVIGRLSEAGIKTDRLADHTRRLQQQTEKYNASLDKTKARLKAVSDYEQRVQAIQDKRAKSMQLASNMAVAGAGVTYASQRTRAAVADPLMVAANFEAQISKVKALTKASNDELQKMVSQSRDLGANTVFGATEVAEAQENLAKAGFKTNQILAATPDTLMLAMAGELDMARATEIAAGTLNGFNLEAAQMKRVSNILAATANTSATDVNLLGESMKMAAGVSSTYGASIEEVSAMLAIMADGNIKGSQSGTALASMYARLTAPTKEAEDALESLQVSMFNLDDGKARKLPDLLKDIAAATADLRDDEKAPLLSAIFGREAGVTASLSALLRASDAQDTLNKKVAFLRGLSDGDYAEDLAKEKTDNFLGVVKNWESATESMKISAGNALIPTIKELTQWITSLTQKVDAFVQANPNVAKWIGIIAIAFAAITAVLGPLMIMISTVIGSYATLSYMLAFASAASARFNLISALGSGILKGVAAAQWLVNAAMSANPIGLVIIAVAGLIALAVAMVDDWGAVGQFFTDLWEGIKNAFAVAVDFIGAYINALMNPIDSIISAFGIISDWFSGDDEKSVDINKRVKEVSEVAPGISDTSQRINRNTEALPAVSEAQNVVNRSKGRGQAFGAALTASVATMPAVANDQMQVVPAQSIAQNQSKQVTVEGDKFEIHLATSPGMDNQEIAAMLRREIERHEQEKQRKLRGMLND